MSSIQQLKHSALLIPRHVEEVGHVPARHDDHVALGERVAVEPGVGGGVLRHHLRRRAELAAQKRMPAFRLNEVVSPTRSSSAFMLNSTTLKPAPTKKRLREKSSFCRLATCGSALIHTRPMPAYGVSTAKPLEAEISRPLVFRSAWSTPLSLV